ncbi:MAG TPA: carboxypeptidase regulatory-like domain-containing protein [Gemmatimonadota bacterium]|jgi:hypothetical protein
MSNRYLRVAILALGVGVMMGGNCDGKGPDFFDVIDGGLNPFTGDIFGRVTVDGTPRAGVTVTVSAGGTVIDTAVTDQNGEYEFLELNPATYTVSVGTITGADCPGDQSAVVVEDDETEVNFACTTPQPQTGVVTGMVTVNGSPESGVAVTLREGTTVIGTTTTGTGGTYSFTNVATGTKNVSIAPPSGATCPTTQQDVTVPAGGTATANFACTRPSGDFTVGLTDLRWEHTIPGVESLECKTISTSPAQAGATWSATVSGPGVISGQTFGGTLDANGRAALRVRINAFGTYMNNVTVISGSVTRNASASVTVGSAANTCVALPSSIRFKRGVVALLPDDVRPLRLNPVAFRYVEPYGDPSIPRIGLIAEEVLEVFPEAVFLDADGRPQAIDYGQLTASVVRELEGRVADAARAAIARVADAL